MGPGLNLETPEEIDRIQSQASAGESPAVEQPIKRKTRETLTAEVWQHFRRGEVQEDGGYTATCLYCGRVYPMGNQRGTGNMKHHIKKGCKKVPASKRQKPDAMQRMLQAGREQGGEAKLVPWQFDQQKCRKSFAKCVIAHEYPFNCAKHHFLKVFLSDVNPQFRLPSRGTIRADCMKIYEEERSLLYDFLGKLDCKVSFTSDLWSCKGRDRGFMSLTCHYIDDSWQMRKRILNFIALPSPHTGKHIAKAIYGKLVDWNLDKRIFSLVLDNSSANDACINELLTTTPLKKVLPADGAIFHLRCGCHILNLIVQDGLSVLSDEIKKIRQIMKYIRHSQQRMEKYKVAATQVFSI